MLFGELLRALRTEAGKSSAELARHLEVSTPYISIVEHGDCTPFTAERIHATAEFLGVDPTALFLAGARERGYIDLSTDVSSEQLVLGAVLQREWRRLSVDDVRRLTAILCRP